MPKKPSSIASSKKQTKTAERSLSQAPYQGADWKDKTGDTPSSYAYEGLGIEKLTNSYLESDPIAYINSEIDSALAQTGLLADDNGIIVTHAATGYESRIDTSATPASAAEAPAAKVKQTQKQASKVRSKAKEEPAAAKADANADAQADTKGDAKQATSKKGKAPVLDGNEQASAPADPLERIASMSSISNYAELAPIKSINLGEGVRKPEDFTTQSAHGEDEFIFNSAELNANPYTKEINRLSQCSSLNQFSPAEQSSLINEYYANFTQALNTIVLNCDNRFMVEQGLEHIMLYAPQVFATEYRNFFYICLSAAPKALFWMLQFPFYANFFLEKQQDLSLHMNRRSKAILNTEEHVAQEVSSTLSQYRELRQQFSNTDTPNINLLDNMMLSLYEEQIMQSQQVTAQPKLTQRQKLRLSVKMGGRLPADPNKLRLNQINHQLLALYNLKVQDIKNMAHTLESLSHTPKKLHKIFGSALRKFSMSQQLLYKKMGSWTQIFPANQPCLLVDLDMGFLMRSPSEPSKVYSALSLKEQPLLILSGLEVCYNPNMSESLSTLAKPSLAKPSRKKAPSSAAATKQHHLPDLDAAKLDADVLGLIKEQDHFTQLAKQMSKIQSEYQASHAGGLDLDDDDDLFDDETPFTFDNLDTGKHDDDDAHQHQLQVLDFLQEEYSEDDDSIQELRQMHSPKNTKRRTAHLNRNSGKASPSQAPESAAHASTYMSGVFYGTQGALNASQLQLFNDRQLNVVEARLSFVVVIL